MISSGTLLGGENLAQPGFFESRHAKETTFGFTSETARIAPGIWGALLLTEAQANEFKSAWHETWERRFAEKPDSAVSKELESEYQRRRLEILNPDQRSLVHQINAQAAEILLEVRGQGLDPSVLIITAREKFRESAPSILDPARIANWEAMGGQGP